ncbi:transglutaminase domain-containing protein [Shewanella avicenniae]|uniref:Transglutaminase domain-containing protein n=1 Tax=Shewanella avicenniae TaxID=2814294 RepID=A0ABX7QSZ1_9GAMM|nr:transglutaminase domain-containing protein [Shewanella avicenniae]QSX34369.1 transglutaminase domain-containing protein [Shewanella avicenniae]
MLRREFLKGAALMSAAGMAAPMMANAAVSTSSELSAVAGRRRFVLAQTYDVKPPVGSEGKVNLWIPLPENTEFQKLNHLDVKGNHDDAYVTMENNYGAKALLVTWADSNKPMKLDVALDISTEDWEPMASGALALYRTPSKIEYPAEVQRYLAPTAHIPTDGIVKATADKIVGSETDPLKKAHKIYLWVSENMERDDSVIGCGQGDVRAILESGKLGGKCTDINSVFVALARAVGLPAREMFGLRLGQGIKMGKYSSAFGSADANGVAKETGGQHCRAMFFLAGFGWVPVDPADVTKMRLKEHMKHSDADVQAVNQYLFGNWEMNWVGFNYARDFELSPAPEQGAMNNFGYPYAEVDGDPLNYYDAKAFAYDYRSTEQR